MMTLDEAIACVRGAVAPLPAERVGLADADGRVLAADITSPMDLPPFDNAAMDGFALAWDASIEAGHALAVAGEQAAGDEARSAAAGGAWEIMTGARVPDGLDCVVPVEDVEVLARHPGGRPARISIEVEPRRGQHVRRRGQDIARGEIAARAGTVVDASVAMLLGGIGIGSVEVRRRPRVALLCTGRELVDDPAVALASGQIYNTNGPFLARRLALAGAEVAIRRTIHDEPEAFREAVLAAQAEGVDLIASTGAVSMGRYDFVPAVLHELGAELLFHKVRMRPGKPLLAARLPGGALCLGLPGNPVSSAVGQRFFVEAALRRLLGMPDERPWRLPLEAEARKKPGFSMLQKASLVQGPDGIVRVRLLQGQESFRTRPMLESRAWAVLPEDVDILPAGHLLDVVPLGHADTTLIREAHPCA